MNVFDDDPEGECKSAEEYGELVAACGPPAGTALPEGRHLVRVIDDQSIEVRSGPLDGAVIAMNAPPAVGPGILWPTYRASGGND